MRSFVVSLVAALSLVLAAGRVGVAQTDIPAASATEPSGALAAATEAADTQKPAGKEVLLPENITRVPRDNDWNNPDAEFCYARSKATDNFVLFWAKEYGDDPAANPDEGRRFD